MTEIEEINEFPMDAACGNCGFRWQNHKKKECPTGETSFEPARRGDLVLPEALDHAFMAYTTMVDCLTLQDSGIDIEGLRKELAKQIAIWR